MIVSDVNLGCQKRRCSRVSLAHHACKDKYYSISVEYLFGVDQALGSPCEVVMLKENG